MFTLQRDLRSVYLGSQPQREVRGLSVSVRPKPIEVPGEKGPLHTLHFTTDATYSHCMHLCNILFLIWISNYFPLVREAKSLDRCLKQEFCLYGQLKAIGIHLDQTCPSSQCIPPAVCDLKAALPRRAAPATRRLLSFPYQFSLYPT